MTIEINIRLDAVGRRFTDPQFEQRSKIIVGLLGKFGTVDHRVRRLRWGQPRLLVAQVHAAEIPSASLFKLAERFQQDCLSVYYPARNEGRLVGPKADAWGKFNLEKFARFDDSLNPKRASTVRPKPDPPSDPAMMEAQMQALYALMRKVFPRAERCSTAPQQKRELDDLIQIVMNNGGIAASLSPQTVPIAVDNCRNKSQKQRLP